MKIIRLTTLLDFGGQEQQYISFTDAPELLKNEYVFVALGYGGHASNVIQQRGFRVVLFNLNYSIKNIGLVWKLYRFFKVEKPDVVHTAAAEANFHGVIAAKLAGVPTIFAEEIGIPSHSKLAQFLFRQVYKLADAVICVSQAVKNHLLQIKEIKEKQGIVLYNPVSIPKQYSKKASAVFNIVFVGRLQKVKNVATLLQAIALNKEDNIHLTIVGDGPEKENLIQLSENLEIKSLVHFVGFQADPAQFVSQADLFVLPSFSEGFGIAVVEAMYQSVPCLCSRVGGIPEFVEEGKTGWLFDPHNQNELASKISMIVNVPQEKLDTIAGQAKAKAFSSFTVHHYCHNLEKLYERKN